MQTENIFVPKVFFVVSDRPHQKSGDHRRVFVEVPLNFEFLEKKPLTRHKKVGVFPADMTEEDFNSWARADTVKGRRLMGDDEAQAAAFATLKRATGRELSHSERVFIHFMSQQKTVDALVRKLEEIVTKNQAGRYKVYGAVVLAYSTNTVCPFCTPALVALQNTYDRGFLRVMLDRMNRTGSSLFTRGFEKSNEKLFRLDTIVTSKVDFDKQGRDLAAKGDHSYQGRTQPPKGTHNHHAKLFYPDDAIDVHRDGATSFFYEFAGKTVHTGGKKKPTYYDSAVFSSGSAYWQSQYLQ